MKRLISRRPICWRRLRYTSSAMVMVSFRCTGHSSGPCTYKCIMPEFAPLWLRVANRADSPRSMVVNLATWQSGIRPESGRSDIARSGVDPEVGDQIVGEIDADARRRREPDRAVNDGEAGLLDRLAQGGPEDLGGPVLDEGRDRRDRREVDGGAAQDLGPPVAGA